MLEEAKDAALAAPVVVTMAMIAPEDARRRGADLLGGLDLAFGDASLKLLQPGAHAFHRLDALGALIGEALVRLDDEHPPARLIGCPFLNQRLRRRRLLAGGDAGEAFDP